MNENHICTLIAKFHSGTLDNQEEAELLAWVKQDAENRQMFKDVSRLLEAWEPELKVDSNKAWQQLITTLAEEKEIVTSVVRTSFFSKWYGVAAVIFLLVMASGIFFLMNRQQNILPDQEMTTINHPGEIDTFHFQLPDGSTVWLNKRSQLTYAQDFGETDRVVELIGEGFFEVAKDPSRPFSVLAQGVRTVALGTSFNVQAFSDQEAVRVSLASGKVSVDLTSLTTGPNQSIQLDPGEEIEISSNSGTYQKEEFSLEERLSWKKGMIFFKAADIHQITKVLSRWYGVRFDIPEGFQSSSQITATYTFEPLEDVLDLISFSADYEFHQEGDRVKVRSK